jgi:hypothetical protein
VVTFSYPCYFHSLDVFFKTFLSINCTAVYGIHDVNLSITYNYFRTKLFLIIRVLAPFLGVSMLYCLNTIGFLDGIFVLSMGKSWNNINSSTEIYVQGICQHCICLSKFYLLHLFIHYFGSKSFIIPVMTMGRNRYPNIHLYFWFGP